MEQLTQEEYEDEIEKLSNLLKKIKFFKEGNVKEKQDLNEISKSIFLEQYNPGEMLFDYGERGSKFYLVMKGTVNIEIPKVVDIP